MNTNYQQHPTVSAPDYIFYNQIPSQTPAFVDTYYIPPPLSHPHSQPYDPSTSLAGAVAEPQCALQGSSQHQYNESPITLESPRHSWTVSHSHSYEQPGYDFDVSPTNVPRSPLGTQGHRPLDYNSLCAYPPADPLDETFGYQHPAAPQAPRALYPISQQPVFDVSASPSSTYNLPTATRIQDQLTPGATQPSEPIQPYARYPSDLPSQAHPAPPSLSQAVPFTSNEVAQESHTDQMHHAMSHSDGIPRYYVPPVAPPGFDVNPAYQPVVEQPGAYHQGVDHHSQPPSRRTSSLSRWADMTSASVASPTAATSPSAPLPTQHQYYSPETYPDVIPAHDQTHQQSAPVVSATQQPLARLSMMPDARVDSRQSSARAEARSGKGNSSTQSEIAQMPVDVVRTSSHVRQAARLRVDVGTADINSPTSHEARLLQRRRRGTANTTAHVGYSPYQRERDERRGSTSRRAQPPTVLSSSSPETPTDRYGAQRTFIFNPYQHPQITSLPDLPASSFPPPLPPVGGGAGSTTVSVTSSSGLSSAQHQTIKFSDVPATTESKGKAVDLRPTEIDPATGEKKPFLACGFCRQRKIACGMRPPHPGDENLPESPRTCNQCARRHILCSYPTESRRGFRKTKRRTIMRDGVRVVIEDDDGVGDEPEDDCGMDKRRRKKGRGPMEWIIAVDGWLVTPAAWDAHLTEAGKGTGAPSSVSRPGPNGQGPRSPDKDDGDGSFTASSSPGAGPSRRG